MDPFKDVNEFIKKLEDFEEMRKETDFFAKYLKLEKKYYKLKEQNKRQQENLKILNKKVAAQRGQLKMLNEAYIPKSRVKEILGIEENISNEKLLDYIDLLVSENNRLEDIEDKKVQIEYQNVFNKGVKSVKKKIEEKIKEYESKGYEEAAGALKEILEEKQ